MHQIADKKYQQKSRRYRLVLLGFTLELTWILFIALACGSGSDFEDASTENKGATENSSNPTISNTATSSTAASTNKNGAEELPPECIGQNCTIPEVSSLSFKEKMILFDANCVLKASEIYDASTHLHVFLLADCSSGTQLYLVNLGYDLAVIGTLNLLSNKCQSGSGKVVSVSIGQNPNGYFIINRCSLGPSSWVSYQGMMKKDAVEYIESVLDVGSTSASYNGFWSDYKSSWNPDAGAWGLLSGSGTRLRRLTADGKQIGGSVWTSSSSNNSSGLNLFSVGGDWLAKGYGSCLRMIKEGIVTCQKSSSLRYYTVKLWDSMFASDGKFSIVNSSNCNELQSGDMPVLNNLWSYLPAITINPIHSFLPYLVANTSSSSSSSTTSSLAVAVLRKSIPPRLISVVPIVDNVTIGSHPLDFGNKKLYAVFIRNSFLYVSMATPDIL